jgi:group I intron endonuclease
MNIYLVRNSITDVFYVGKTIQTIAARWSKHLSDAKRGSSTHLHRAIRKYGADAFVVDPLVLVGDDIIDEQSLNDAERLMIRLLRKSSRLYNLTDGGEGTSGWAQSQETRRKIGEGNRGKILSTEHRRKIGEANSNPSEETRRKLSKAASNPSEETRRNKSEAQKGKKHSEETRHRICKALKGNKNSLGCNTKTHCERGHERTPENVYQHGGCRACTKVRNAARPSREKYASAQRELARLKEARQQNQQNQPSSVAAT